MSSTLHASDLAAWAKDSAALLRQGAELDEEQRDQIAGELELMGQNAHRERNSRTVTLIIHLLKISYQQGKRSRSWDLTVGLQRVELEGLLEESPSLNHGYTEDLPKLYRTAKRLAEIETGLDIFPEQNPFTLDQILNG